KNKEINMSQTETENKYAYRIFNCAEDVQEWYERMSEKGVDITYRFEGFQEETAEQRYVDDTDTWLSDCCYYATAFDGGGGGVMTNAEVIESENPTLDEMLDLMKDKQHLAIEC